MNNNYMLIVFDLRKGAGKVKETKGNKDIVRLPAPD